MYFYIATIATSPGIFNNKKPAIIICRLSVINSSDGFKTPARKGKKHGDLA
ncbi:hypothetical protein ESA_03818 [Cronobacter sakazakii ATCC BAA-894]|uniref:Uncharacterized protein n=1 Tax=Cronobacter sakazakii (strain ATCC BAA-894) TaxID=290339 RepID=A7MNG3_CROS8|nr:hypothetical protein ESA_03818 [Cronobacter sakazakii ATCC BAA-894]